MAPPALPPSPLYLKGTVPPKLRPFAFLPLALVAGLLVLFLVGLIVNEFEIALAAGLVLGPVLAWAAVGPPFTREGLAKAAAKMPKAPPDKRPFLFFPAALVSAAVLYFLVGLVITTTPLDEDLLALLALAAAVPAAAALAFLVYGFPKVRHLRQLPSPLEKVPPAQRPYLFFPLGLLVAAPVYILVGFAFTEVLDPDIAVLLALLAGLAAGFGIAYRLVGVPRPEALLHRVQQLPEVPARARPALFLAFVLLVGAALATALGGTVGALDVVNVDLAFPLFLLAGWLLAVPLAGHLFGYPVPDRPLRAYAPRLAPEQRPALLLPLTLGLGLALMFLLGAALALVPFADLEDAYLAGALAFPLAFLAALRILGLRGAQLDPRGLASLPERARPLVLLALGTLLGTILFTAVGQLLTTFAAGFAVSYAAGFALALALVDQPFLAALARRGRARKELEQAIEARLRAEMGLLPPAAAEGGEAPRRRRFGKGKA